MLKKIGLGIALTFIAATALGIGATTRTLEFDDWTTLTTNGDLTATPNGTGKLKTDNLSFDGNTIASENTDGNVVILPNGNGSIILTPGGTGTVDTDNLRFDANTISSTDANGNIIMAPNGTGEVEVNSNMLVGDDDGESAHTIGGASVQSGLEVHQSGGTALGGISSHRLVDSATLGSHWLGLKARGTSASPAAVQAEDVLTRFVSTGYDGTDYEIAAEIRSYVDGTPGSNDMPGRIGFYTTPDGSATPAQRLLIDNAGHTNVLAQGELRLQDAAGGEYMGFKSPVTLTGSQTFTLPDGDGTNGQVLKTNGSGTLTWNADEGAVVDYESISSTDTTDAANRVIGLSGASFTLTLHTAVGNTGQILTLLHNGTSLTQAYTLATTSSQTIGGVAGGSYVLHTNGERLRIVSDGSNWQILDHRTEGIVYDSTITVTGTTSNPSKGTVVRDNLVIYRKGNMARFKFDYYHSAAGTAGSGTYLYALPTGMAFDTNYITTTSSTVLADTTIEASLNIPGANALFRSDTAVAARSYKVLAYSSTQIYLRLEQVGGVTIYLHDSSSFPYSEVIGYNIDFEAPISGWQP